MKTEASISARQWWFHKRITYNKGLIIAGIVAFLLYCILGQLIIAPRGDFEVTLFTTFFQGFAYLFMIGIANAFYSLGWIMDISFNKNDDLRFRERLFALGYWFSISLPILLILSIMIRFLIWGE